MSRIDAITELLLPDYQRRHVFAAKLRVVAFVGFLVIYLYFLRDVLGQTKAVAAIVFIAFLLTGFAYYNVMRRKMLAISFSVELVSDLTAMTAILYLTGGPYSPYYTIYLFYVIIAGVLYNHYLAAFIALCSAAYYGAFLLLCRHGIIPPLILDYGDKLPIPTYTPFAHFLFAAVFFAGIIYTVKVASIFSQQRERSLEKRNRELMALHRMTSTIRSANELRDVIDDVLTCVLDGLGFEAACLINFDRPRGVAHLHVPKRTPHIDKIEKIVGVSLDRVTFPLDVLGSSIMDEISKHRMIFRRDLIELTAGVGGDELRDKCQSIQSILGVKRIVVMPIMVEKGVLGALVGFSGEPFVEEQQVTTMESFANQSALSLEAATLIDRLKHLNIELEEANKVKSDFLATMSHELRTPLTAIIGFSELLVEGVMGELNSEQKDSLKEVLHNSADLLDMINCLLDLTKIESGKMRLDIQPFDLEATLKRVCSTITPLVKKKRQKLKVDVQVGIPPILGDQRKIQQTLLNLIANANKFTPEGGHIQASIRHFASWDEIRKKAKWWHRMEALSDMFGDGAMEIVIDDNGIGIKPQHIELVFDMFHQADSSVTRSFGGTGLGLALARKFVEMHGGRIWVESEWGKGATFTIAMPIRSVTSCNA